MEKSIKFYLSVEGDNEQWYFEYLRDLINYHPNVKNKISLKFSNRPITSHCKIIDKYIKLNIQEGTAFFARIEDYESKDKIHVEKFDNTLKEYKKSKKVIKSYSLGYSNFTFDLWMILHKKDCNSQYSDRHLYVGEINKAYNKKFQFLDDYKNEGDFHRILKTITILDVLNAIIRAENIVKTNEANKNKIFYSDFEYFKDNPDLTVHKVVKKMLLKSGII